MTKYMVLLQIFVLDELRESTSNRMWTIWSSPFTFYNCCYNLYHEVKGHGRIYTCFHTGSCQSSASYGTVSKRQILLCKFHIYFWKKDANRTKLKQMLSKFQLICDTLQKNFRKIWKKPINATTFSTLFYKTH